MPGDAQEQHIASRAAAFLDRDGTINCHRGYILRPEDIELLPGATEAIRALNAAGVLAVIVTNQSAVGRGLCTDDALDRIHDALRNELAAGGATVDAIYVCPHAPGVHGEAMCACRKPEPGMLLRAARDLHIDLARSAMFGDTPADVEAARRVGVRAYLIEDHFASENKISTARSLCEGVMQWLEDRASQAPED